MRIGLILNILDEEYQISVYHGIKKAVEAIGASLVCYQLENDKFTKDNFIARFPEVSFFDLDGVILLTSVFMDNSDIQNKTDIEAVLGDMPVVSIGQEIEGVPSFTIQADDSMKQLVEHLLLEHKYKKFVYLSGVQNHNDTIMREKIFVQTMEAYKPWFSELKWTIKKGNFTERAAIQAMEEYYEENPDLNPDVVVCANDNMAIGVYKFFKINKDNPKICECAVTGFDDIPQAKFEIPSLTTIHQPLEEVGVAAFDGLMEMLKSKSAKVDNKFVESKVIFRHSCGCEDGDENIAAENGMLEQLQTTYVLSEQMLRMVTHVAQDLNYANSMDGFNYVVKMNTDQLELQNYCILKVADRKITGKYEIENAKVSPVFVRKNGNIYNSNFYGRILSIGEFYREYLQLDGDNCSLIFKRLTSGNELVGFVFYDAAENQLPYLSSINISIAQAISRIESFKQKQERSEYLEKEIFKRTQELMEANSKRLEVEAEVLRISELERQRFSTDLHDDICQRLAGISMLCRSYANQNNPIEKNQMVELAQLISDTLQTTRQYAHNSYPVELESLGMNHAINNLVDSFGKQTDINCTYEWSVLSEENFDKLQKLNIFRIIQEALHNVGKHANATSVSVSLRSLKKKTVIQICDNGKGIAFKDDVRIHGLGLNSMQYRANQIGATFKIKNNKPKGTIVEIKL